MRIPFSFIKSSGGGTPAPTLTAVSTAGGAVGDIAGGYPATLTGTNFTGATGVTFGGTAATSVVVVNSTTITCVVPAHATGSASVVVTTAGGSNVANSSFRYFSPAELNLSGWWRANYAGAPWSATASAGVSATTGTLASGGADPTTGTALNGYTPAKFDGATQFLTNAATMATLFTAGAGSIMTLANPRTLAAANAGVYLDAAFLCDDNVGNMGFSINSSGAHAFITDAGGYKNATTGAVSLAAYHAMMMRWDSSVIAAALDAAAEVTSAAGAATGLTGTAYVGKSYVNATFLDASVMELMTAPLSLTGQNRADIRSYFNTRYFPAGAQV